MSGGPAVLTTASTLTCGHGFTVAAATSSRLTVGGNPVLAAPLTGRAVNCSVPADPSTGTKPCTKVASVTVGDSARLTVGGASVLLAGLAGLTDGGPPATGTPIVPATANQNRLRAAAAVA